MEREGASQQPPVSANSLLLAKGKPKGQRCRLGATQCDVQLRAWLGTHQ